MVVGEILMLIYGCPPPLEVLTSRQERSSEIKSTVYPASDFGWYQRRRHGRVKGYRKQNSGTSSHGTILSARYLIEWSEEIAFELSLRLLCKRLSQLVKVSRSHPCSSPSWSFEV